ncbi:MAG TPA: DUF5663 domain-containing protein [Candidatus Moranbacteria bacterium]|nr:DUF5663 domain-containing protein [Candidatus Moranbacteria bacterium]
MENKNKSLDEFVDRLVREKGIRVEEDSILAQVRKDLLERVEDRINATILQHMPADKLQEFNELLEFAREEEIQEYCQKNIPNLDEIVARELLDLRDTYLNP